MKALNNECAREAVNFIYKHGDLTYGSAYDAIQLLTSNGFAIYRTDGDEQVVYTDPDGKVWHPHRGYWCWKVSNELAQAQKRIKELEAEPAPTARSGAVDVLKDVLSHLVAAHSLLSRSPKTAAASDKMFDQMLADYQASIGRGRAALAALEPAEPATDAEPVAWLYDWVDDDGATQTEASTNRISSVNFKPTSNVRPLYTRPPESRLREALEALVHECEEYARINKLHSPDGSPATTAAMAVARAALAQEDGRNE